VIRLLHEIVKYKINEEERPDQLEFRLYDNNQAQTIENENLVNNKFLVQNSFYIKFDFIELPK